MWSWRELPFGALPKWHQEALCETAKVVCTELVLRADTTLAAQEKILSPRGKKLF